MESIEKNKTLIAGASNNPDRYAFMAAQMLASYKHDWVPVGIKKGEVLGKSILHLHDNPSLTEVDTVTLYIGPKHQPAWYDYIVSLKPRRVIFNPGTENSEFSELLHQNNIETIEACTLVMLRTNQF